MKKQGPALVMFSEARIAFEKEVRENHPKIMMQAILASKESGVAPGEVDQGIVIGCAAAQFGIIMEGMYSPEQLDDMYDHLFHRLRDSRKHIISAGAPGATGSAKRIDKVALDSISPADFLPPAEEIH